MDLRIERAGMRDLHEIMEIYGYARSFMAENGNAETGAVALTVRNNRGATLPETGGMGTTLFYVIGGLLVVGAGILLVVRFRMRASNKE